MQQFRPADGLDEPDGDAVPRTAEQLWQAALLQLQQQVTRPNYDTYLRDTVGSRFEEGRLVVAAPSDFVTEWLSARLRVAVTQTVRQILGEQIDISFEVLGAPGSATAT